MRKRWHVLTLLTVATPVLASAGMIGIAETREGSYTVVRGVNETVVARAQTPVLLNDADRVATRESEVRIRMVNGSAVVVRNGVVSFPSENAVRVHSGEAVVSFPEGSEMVVESGEYRFTRTENEVGASSLVVASPDERTVAARSLRGQFAVSDSSASRVASIHAPSPSSAMLVSTSTQSLIPAGIIAGGVASRPDVFVYAAPSAAPTTVADALPTTVAGLPDSVSPAPRADGPIGPIAPLGGGPGLAGELPGFQLPTDNGAVAKDLDTYDLTQPVSSFVTEPGDRPPRPRR